MRMDLEEAMALRWRYGTKSDEKDLADAVQRVEHGGAVARLRGAHLTIFAGKL
jgi:hypothetical protein